jgi:4-amino-4-deoxy-L-arabinose transferase-like glycosyltransferase
LISTRRLALFALLVIILTHFFHLGTLPFMGWDEPRYARIGEEMLERGSFVTPTLNLLPWLEKPPLLFWLEAASYRVFGVAEWSARLPVAFLSALAILFTSYFAFRIAGLRAAFLSFFILSTSGLFIVYSRAASTDMPLASMFTFSVLSAELACRTKRIGWALLTGTALALAVLAKGPVALILFGLIFVPYCLLKGGLPWSWTQLLLAGLVFASVTTPWFWLIWQENGYNFIATFFLNHHIARYLTPVHRHSQPFWFFAAVLLGGFFPWIFFMGSSVLRVWRERWTFSRTRESTDLLLWLWFLVPVLFFSLSASKLAGYILPVFPALALLVALEWDRYFGDEINVTRVMKRQVAGLCAFSVPLGLGLILGSAVAYQTVTYGLYMAIPILLGVWWGWYEFRKHRPIGLFFSLVGGMSLFAALAFSMVAPGLGDFHSTKDLVLSAKDNLSEEEPLILYRFFHHTALYYSDYHSTPEAIPSVEALKEYLSGHPQARYYLLSKAGGLKNLRKNLDLESVTRKGNFYLSTYAPPKEGAPASALPEGRPSGTPDPR